MNSTPTVQRTDQALTVSDVDRLTTYRGAPGLHSEAYRIHAYGGPEQVRLEDIPIPPYSETQVLVHVLAAGVNVLDWAIRDGLMKESMPLEFPVTLGFEIAGVVVARGSKTEKLAVGDRVAGPLLRMGAYADFVAIDESELCVTPSGLSDVEAAAIPVASLTGWQAVEAGGGAHAGRKFLVHGATGAVGSFAVQFAKAAGATVFATATAENRAYVLGLGADVAIDYATERFEDKAKEMDVVLAFVGGETLDRSWSALAPDGILVSVANPNMPGGVPPGRRGIGIQMHNDPKRLQEFADAVGAGTLKSTIAEVIDRSDLAAGIEFVKTGHAPGKIVIDFRR